MASHEDAAHSLATHLATLSREELTRLLNRRPEAGLPPHPESMFALAERLLIIDGLRGAVLGLTRPELQVAEAVAALGDGCAHTDLAGLLGLPVDDTGLRTALDGLAGTALVWRDGSALRSGRLDEVWPQPLRLGPPASALLAERTLDELRRTARALGLGQGRGKAELVRNLAGWMSDGDKVREMAAAAPADTRRTLQKLAWEDVSPYYLSFGGPPPAASQWAVEHGLLVKAGWNGQARMPCEVALALRGAEYRAPFDPLRPPVVTAPVVVDAVRREAAAAATAAVAGMTAVVEAAGQAPVAMLKTGGIGVREVRRIAKTAGMPEQRVRLFLEVAACAELIAVTDAGVVPTEGYDEYAAAEPAEQLLELLDAWLELPTCPLRPATPGVPTAAALAWESDGPIIIELRTALLDTLVSLPAGERIADPAAIVDLVKWHRPVIADLIADELPRLTEGLWREAHELGLLAHGASSDLCRRVVDGDGDGDAVLAEATAALPEARTSVVLQADLTAVVTGVPSAPLMALLDSAADQESRSGAWTWRFSQASVRRALDAGVDPDELLTGLTEAAEGGRVPQPLSYLVGDVARRHGRVRVRPVGCCLRSDDTALLAEILRAKGLSKLGLSLLAPTVLSSAAPLAETLAALRAAGYAPVGENPDGSRAVEPTSKHRATRVPTPPPSARIHFSGTHGRLPESIVDLGWDELDEAAGYPFDAEILNPADLAMQLTGNRGTRSQMPST